MQRPFSLHRLAVVLALTLPALAAAPITGTVTNRTTNKPAAGDTVVLIRLAQGMQESTKTTTDARGRFKLDVPDDGIHLVRVTHQGANYFKPVPPGTSTADVDVYNVAAHVPGVSTEAVVIRAQTADGGKTLKVTENFFLKNQSSPPLTQFSQTPFDFYLPEGAVVEGAAALAPGGMPVQAAPVPLAEKNHFTFIFPIRPGDDGETRFQVSYHVPYSGKLTLDPHVTSPTDTIAVMLPKAMTFTNATGAPFSAVNDEVNAQTFVARQVQPGQPTAFSLSGEGELPRDTQQTQAGTNSASPSAAQDGTPADAPGKGLGNPLDPEGNRDPWGKYKWWIVAVSAIILAVVAGLMLRKPVAATTNTSTPASDLPLSPNTALHVLKEELFALETDRMRGLISDTEYTEHKAALERVIHRVLNRQEPQA